MQWTCSVFVSFENISYIMFCRYKEADYNMTVSDYDKRTALHIAVNNNQEHVVEYLLKIKSVALGANKAKDRYTISYTYLSIK